jgi:hypothetical protein
MLRVNFYKGVHLYTEGGIGRGVPDVAVRDQVDAQSYYRSVNSGDDGKVHSCGCANAMLKVLY